MRSRMAHLWAELKRRKVVKVAAAYGAAAVGIWTIADLSANTFALPESVVAVLVLLMLVGFPFALALAWVYEVRRETPAADASGLEHTSPSERRKSIVVLPFDNMSPDPGDAYFSDGLTEEIIGQLSHVQSLRVISRSSAMALKRTGKDVRTIGRELEVEYVLEGSVRRDGDDLRITAQLIDATSDAHLWTKSFDRQLRDIFDTQSEIALSVAGALHASLDPDRVERIKAHPTYNLDAHDAYLLGRQHWWSWTHESIKKAREYLERAVELDPGYADAHAALASLYLVAGGGGFGLIPTAEAMEKGKAAAEKAIALDPTSGEAHGTLGLILAWFYWEWQAAEASVRRGVDVDPNSSVAWGGFAHVMDAIGKNEDSVYGSERFVELDPLQGITLNNAAIHCCHAGQLDRAMEFAERGKELEPVWLGVYAKAYVLLVSGRYEDALAELAPYEELLRQTFADAVRGYLLAKTGATAEFEVVVSRLQEALANGRATPTELATAYMGKGDHDRALELLEAAPDQRPPGNNWTAWMGTVPLFEPDPGWFGR